jgi:hypothetical protein
MNSAVGIHTLEQAADTAVLAARECQLVFDRAFDRLDVQQCRMNFETGQLDLLGSQGVLSTDATLLGTVDDDGTWRWAWQEQPWLSPEAGRGCEPVRRFGREAGIPELVTPELPDAEDRVEDLVLAAQSVIPGRPWLPFRASPQAEGYYLLDAPELRLDPPGIVRVSQLLSEALAHGAMADHRLAVAGYQRARGIVASGDPNGASIRWHLTGGDLLITFDDQDRMTGMVATGPTAPELTTGSQDH